MVLRCSKFTYASPTHSTGKSQLGKGSADWGHNRAHLWSAFHSSRRQGVSWEGCQQWGKCSLFSITQKRHILTSEMTFCYYCLSIHGNGCPRGQSIAIIKHLVKIWIKPWEGVMQDSDLWSVIWIGYIFLLQ